MTAEEHVYFPRTGTEATRFILVRLTGRGEAAQATMSIAGPLGDGEDVREAASEGAPHEVLREAREKAAVTGLDLRIELDGTNWDEKLGSLVDAK